MRPLVTASAIGRAIACPASVYLPRVESEAGQAAQRGSALHQCVEDALSVGVESVTLHEWAPQWPLAAVVDAVRRVHGGQKIGTEVPFALEPVSGRGRRLKAGAPREYKGIKDGEVAGTVDQISGGRGGSPIVISDLKTGRIKVPPDCAQMALLALMSSDHYGSDYVESVIIECEVDATAADDVRVKRHAFDRLDLDTMSADIAQMERDIADKMPPVEGDHCRWCPAEASCPLKSADLETVSEIPAITRDTAGEVWTAIERGEAAIKAARAALSEIASGGAIDLGDGRRLGMVETRREKIVAATALGVLWERYGQDGVIRAANTSKAAIKRALPPAAESGTLESIIEEIRERGGISESLSTTLRVIEE